MIREEERNKASKDYRNFRESCGVKDPIMLDEIEEAYYEGADWADQHPRKGLVDINKVCKFLDGYSFIPTYVINELKNEFSKGE